VLLVHQTAFAADPKARKKLDDSYVKFTPAEFVSRVASGDRKTVDLFIQAGIDVNAPGARGRTALLEAASRDDAKLLAALLAARCCWSSPSRAASCTWPGRASSRPPWPLSMARPRTRTSSCVMRRRRRRRRCGGRSRPLSGAALPVGSVPARLLHHPVDFGQEAVREAGLG